MNEIHKTVINHLIKKANPEQIYFHDLEKIHLYLIVWDINRSSFHKRLHIRRVFDSTNIVFDTPYDIIVLTRRELQAAIANNDIFTLGILNDGELLYQKGNVTNIEVM